MVDSDDADKSLKKIDKSTEGVGNKLAKGIGTAAKFGVGLAVAAGAGAAALFGVAVKSAEATDRIDKLSNKIGLSRKGFQEWDFIMSQSGASVEVLQSGFKTFSKQIDEASKGTKLSTGYFKDLGVSITDNSGKLKTQEEMFNETVVALQGMEEGPKKAALASNLLGKSASELAPLINGAAGSVEEMRKKANDLGLVLSDTAIDAGVKFTDSMDQIKRSLGAMGTKIGAEVMPIVQRMLEWVTNHMPQIQAISSRVFGVISTAIQAVGRFISNTLVPAFQSFLDWIQPYMPQIKDAVVVAFDLIKGAFKLVGDFITNVVIPIYKGLADWFFKNFPLMKDAVMKAYNYIKPSFDNLVQVIRDSVMPIIMGLWETVKKAMPGIKAIFELVFPLIVVAVKLAIDIIASVIKTVKDIYDFIKPSLDKVADIFSTVFGGIKKVIEGVQKVLDFFNGTKMKDKSSTVTTRKITSYEERKGNLGGSYAVGSRYIPFDQVANIHEGEMIIPKSENPYANSGGKILPNGNKGLTLSIGTFVNNRKEDIEELAEELEFYRKKKSLSRG